MRKKILSKKEYPPKCDYCKHGRLSPDGESILCEKKGIVERDSSCRAYKYDVMKRVPYKQPLVKSADPSDFEL